jgi:putative PIN family toxin of toxin-antitoxin system
MREREHSRVVIDTNVYISSFLRPNSFPTKAIRKAEQEALLLVSDSVLGEFTEVFSRPKFDKYVSRFRREAALRHIRSISTVVAIPYPIRACRDPRDDKFLEVAVHGRADVIVTGDTDLLALHPFREIAILTPTEYLAQA